MSRFSGMYDVRVNQYVTVSLLFVVGVVLAVILTDDALSAFKPFKYVNAKIESETIGSVRLADLDPPPPPRFPLSFIVCVLTRCLPFHLFRRLDGGSSAIGSR